MPTALNRLIAITVLIGLAAVTYLAATWVRGYPPEAPDIAVAMVAGPPVLLVTLWAATEWARQRAGVR